MKREAGRPAMAALSRQGPPRCRRPGRSPRGGLGPRAAAMRRLRRSRTSLAQEKPRLRKSPSPGARLLPRCRVQQLILCRSVVPLLSALRGCLVCNLGFLFLQTLHADGSVFIQQPQRAVCPIFSHSFPPCPRWCCVCGEVQGCFYPGTVEPIPSRGKTSLRQRFPLKPRVDTGPLGPDPPPQALGRGTPQLFLHSGCWRGGSPPSTNQECCRWSGCSSWLCIASVQNASNECGVPVVSGFLQPVS